MSLLHSQGDAVLTRMMMVMMLEEEDDDAGDDDDDDDNHGCAMMWLRMSAFLHGPSWCYQS